MAEQQKKIIAGLRATIARLTEELKAEENAVDAYREHIDKCTISRMSALGCMCGLQEKLKALESEVLPEGITAMPSKESFELDDEAKHYLRELFRWQEQSEKTHWVLGKPLGYFKQALESEDKT